MMKKLSIVIASLAVLAACATSIREMNIDTIDIQVEDKHDNPVSRMLPGAVYTLDFRVRDTQGETYLNPNYRDFQFEDLYHIRVAQQARFLVKLETSIETFHPPGSPAYSFQVGVKQNSFPAQRLEYQLDWDRYDTLDFSGRDGADGEEGERGYKAAGDSGESVRGGSGEDGLDGLNGLNGRDTRLLLLMYQYEDEQKLFFYEPERQQLFLTDIKRIHVDTSGGDGGRGGSGGDGGSGTDYYDETEDVTTPGVQGRPGDGGDGGNGGNAGDLTLLSPNPQLFNYLQPDASGGKGGPGGAGGRGYDSAAEEFRRGDRGDAGHDGWDGRVNYRVLSRSETETLLSQILAEGFDPSKVIYRP